MSGNIIKTTGISPPMYRGTIKRDVHEATLEAKQILDQARTEGAQITAQAERDRESIFEEARQQGYSKGLGGWNETLVNAWKYRDDLLARSEPELVRLAVRIARRIVGAELVTKPETILRIVNEAVKTLRAEKKLTIRVNPEQEDRVRAQTESFRQLAGNVGQILVVGDPTIGPEGCVVESELGIIDAQLETQLERLEEALLQGRRQ
jgi:type III secretion protein L